MVDKPAASLFQNPQLPLSASEERDRNLKAQIAKERAQGAAKTARLKALRLAQEAANAAAPQPKPQRKKATARPKP